MSTHLKKKEECILKILTRVSKESAKGTPIVVEGRKDVETLRILGVMGPIIPAKTGGKSFLDVISKIEDNETRKVILLLDFDKRGKEGTFHLRRCLERIHVNVNSLYWGQLSCLLGKDIQGVESLDSYLETLNRKAHSSDSRLSNETSEKIRKRLL